MAKNNMTAIQKRLIQKHLDNGETRFFIGAYYYEAEINGMIRRREQVAGRTPTSDWARVGSWDPSTWKIVME